MFAARTVEYSKSRIMAEAYAVSVIFPRRILNERIIEQLTDNELSAVFFHELTHVKRKHALLERLYDYTEMERQQISCHKERTITANYSGEHD